MAIEEPLKLKNMIDGEFVDPVDGQTEDVISPATGEVIATAPGLSSVLLTLNLPNSSWSCPVLPLPSLPLPVLPLPVLPLPEWAQSMPLS